MIQILCEQPYRESLWCKEILSGLLHAMKKKRLSFTEISDTGAIKPRDEVFVLGSHHVWLNNVIYAANQKGIKPILLSNRLEGALHGQYHSVYTDINGSMAHLIALLTDNGKKRLALYGVNTTSVSDISRMQSFQETTDDTAQVFYNDGSLDNCFASFLPHSRDFDAVICVNGLVAVSLVKKILEISPAVLDTLMIISCSKNSLDSIYAKHILSLDANYGKLGAAALLIADCVKKNPYLSNMTLTVTWDMDETRFAESTETKIGGLQTPHHSFYEDTEAAQMLRLDALLDCCSETDLKILKLLIRHTPYREIAEACFMSESNVKYHIKKYLDLTQAKSTTELVNLLKLYDS
ncbi:MAG: winged helix-turn-helix transcriptional regulator [Clostridia bacterium]|nr:winged helix-turn-helix transcriptional regulator [Clostridia bacterium]